MNGYTDGYTIKIVSRRTGLSQHLIRMWERRYNAVTPKRTETNRRLYSNSDIEKLCILQKATLAGHSIGRIAQLPLEQLRELIAQDTDVSVVQGDVSSSISSDHAPDSYLNLCIDALKCFDTDAIEKILMQASITLSQPDVIEKVVSPLMMQVGKSWQQGTLRTAHEHAISGVVRTFLGNFGRSHSVPDHAPRAIITTPSGQLHEIGALMAAVTAAADGWHVTYLGPNLPAQEIAVAAISKNARAVLLSVVYPQDDPYLVEEITKLYNYLPDETTIVIGGRAAEAYEPLIKSKGVIILPDLKSLHRELESLRTSHA